VIGSLLHQQYAEDHWPLQFAYEFKDVRLDMGIVIKETNGEIVWTIIDFYT